MSVHPGSEAEYEARHSPIWSELEETLKDYGVSTYSIFLHTFIAVKVFALRFCP